MPSLKKRVAQQRDILMGRGASIREQAERVHSRLRHPAFLVPAFLGGVLVARVGPVVRALPDLTARLSHLTDQLGRLHAMLRLIAALVPVLSHTPDRSAQAEIPGR